MQNIDRFIPFPDIANFRDIGGYSTSEGAKVAMGLIYRSGHLADITPETGDKLAQMNVQHVVDFRSDHEKEWAPLKTVETWSPDYHAVPIGGNAAAWIKSMLDEMGSSKRPGDPLFAEFIKAFQNIPTLNVGGIKGLFDVLRTRTQGAVLFHCTAGKDRTGVTGALILKTLGVHRDDIYQNFMDTNRAVNLEKKSVEIAEKVGKRLGMTVNPKDILPLVGVAPEFLDATFAIIDEKYGCFENYQRDGLGLDVKAIDHLRKTYLE